MKKSILILAAVLFTATLNAQTFKNKELSISGNYTPTTYGNGQVAGDFTYKFGGNIVMGGLTVGTMDNFETIKTGLVLETIPFQIDSTTKIGIIVGAGASFINNLPPKVIPIYYEYGVKWLNLVGDKWILGTYIKRIMIKQSGQNQGGVYVAFRL